MEDKDNIIKLSTFNQNKTKVPFLRSKLNMGCNVKGCAEALNNNYVPVLLVNDAGVLDVSTDARKVKQGRFKID